MVPPSGYFPLTLDGLMVNGIFAAVKEALDNAVSLWHDEDVSPGF